MKERLRFTIEHGLFNTQYTFIIKQETRYVENKKYGKVVALVTTVDLLLNNKFVESAQIIKHANDTDNDKIAFYRVLDRLVFNRFVKDKGLRTKIFNGLSKMLNSTVSKIAYFKETDLK